MSSEKMSPGEIKAMNKAKRDSIVLDAMAEVTVASETILKALEKMRNSGSSLYKHKFKQLTNQYRKECFGVLNQYYDFMETGGVSDSFIGQMKRLGMLHSAMGDLTNDQVNKVGMFIGEMLEPDPVNTITEHLGTSVEEITKEALDEVVAVGDGVDIQHEINPVGGVAETNEEVSTHHDYEEEEKELTYEDVLGDEEVPVHNPLEAELNKSKKLESSPAKDVDYTPLDKTSVLVSQKEFNIVKQKLATEGVFESDLLKKTLESMSVRNGIDTDMYDFASADPVGDNLVLNYKLK